MAGRSSGGSRKRKAPHLSPSCLGGGSHGWFPRDLPWRPGGERGSPPSPSPTSWSWRSWRSRWSCRRRSLWIPEGQPSQPGPPARGAPASGSWETGSAFSVAGQARTATGQLPGCGPDLAERRWRTAGACWELGCRVAGTQSTGWEPAPEPEPTRSPEGTRAPRAPATSATGWAHCHLAATFPT